ncbi:MAG: hypothetical protein E7170_01800 [Firmicutes bacterium]|nr:hypothetical protein [Bacillota bacterium]
MPAYLSHAVFSHKAFKSLEKYKLFKIDVPISKLRFDSIKTDFFAYKSKRFLCYDENHNCYVQKFVKTQMEYIIENRLYENIDVMSEFYGHILHTIMDQVFHPFIYSMTDNYKTNGMPIKGKHFELESLIDSYLASEYLNLDIKDYARFCVDSKYMKLSKEEKDIIKYSYGKVYGYSNLELNSFIFALSLILEELIIRCDSTSVKRSFYEKFSFKYLSRNIKPNEYLDKMNLENKKWLNLNDLNISNSSIDDLYKMALNRSLEIIEVLNLNIYDKRKIDDSFYKVFEDISLDTGVKCSYQKRI